MIELVAETYVPKPLDRFFDQGKRFYILYGGRGSGKSWAVAAELIEMSLLAKHRILCCREIQNSIKHSVKKLLEDTIGRLGLVPFFEVRDTMILCRPTGSEFLFAGLRHNSTAIKSMEGLTAAWIEEGQSVSEQSFTDLTPTIRQSGGYIVITMNPRLSTDYLYETFVAPDLLRPDAARVRMNWDANQEFPETLRGEMEWDRDNHPAKYRHVWEGELLVDDEALVFRNNVTSEWFDTPGDAEFMFGADFGFAHDPSTLIRTFMSEDESIVFVDYEAGGIGIELDRHPDLYDEIPRSGW
ncbi:MAG: PBSX family phage terminase large subunit [Geminicoccales bacterium]